MSEKVPVVFEGKEYPIDAHWSQVKKIRTKSRKLKNRVKLIENRQLKNLISP